MRHEDRPTGKQAILRACSSLDFWSHQLQLIAYRMHYCATEMVHGVSFFLQLYKILFGDGHVRKKVERNILRPSSK